MMGNAIFISSQNEKKCVDSVSRLIIHKFLEIYEYGVYLKLDVMSEIPKNQIQNTLKNK